MDFVPGVKQKLLARRVPHESKELQLPPQEPPSQNTTLLVATRQLVPGAAMQTGPLVTVVQEPPQLLPVRFEQNVTVTICAASEDSSESGLKGFPM